VSASIAVGASNAALLDALAAPPPTTTTTTAADAAATSALPFDWAAHWYPIAALDSLDPTVPFPLTILGERIVVWRDGEGAWKALRDACPHRLAPLSEGRIAEDGTLQVRRGGTSSAALRRCAFRCLPACRA
jgi:phenylpropionate dioxygenase-like ring-hydroxylating dioxygenase large terminal subunit